MRVGGCNMLINIEINIFSVIESGMWIIIILLRELVILYNICPKLAGLIGRIWAVFVLTHLIPTVNLLLMLVPKTASPGCQVID